MAIGGAGSDSERRDIDAEERDIDGRSGILMGGARWARGREGPGGAEDIFGMMGESARSFSAFWKGREGSGNGAD